MSRKEKAAVSVTSRDNGGGDGTAVNSIDYHTTSTPSLSIDPLKVAGLHGELADYWLDRCKAMLGANDPLFNRAFEKVRFFAGLADIFLERGAGR